MSTRRRQRSKATEFFRKAECSVIAAGFAWEISWQKQRLVTAFSECDLLREAAWVILCSGFRETTVRKCFDYISLCFCDWESASAISQNRSACIATATTGFRNARKLEAIATVADVICADGFSSLSDKIRNDPIAQLQRLPFIGAITSWHLAKNLGLDVAKNDRHLARLAARFGYHDAHELCGDIADRTGEPTAVIDIVLWRHAALGSEGFGRMLTT